jgi:hypothetical protein
MGSNKLAIFALALTLAFSPASLAQSAQPNQGTHLVPVWSFDPADRAIGDGGPAPKRDFTGSWAGPRSGAGVPDPERGEPPLLTEAGKKLFEPSKPLDKYSPAGTNDPTVRSCDPFGFPRSAIDQNRGIAFAVMPSRIILMSQLQDSWREIWMDGRELPKNVGGTEKGAPDPRYYGYSVGHWENDNTLVVETTGLDENTWLTKSGYPHTTETRVEERYTRADHNDLRVTLTVEDPKIYTKPFSLGTVYFRWNPNQLFDEKLCIPSDTIEYLKSVGDPAGMDPKLNAPPQPQSQR